MYDTYVRLYRRYSIKTKISIYGTVGRFLQGWTLLRTYVLLVVRYRKLPQELSKEKKL